MPSNFKKVIDKGTSLYVPSVSVDCVIFGFHENELRVLLLKMKHTDLFGLPGGFILKGEHADLAASRVLQERTDLKDIFLKQFHTFTEPARSDKKFHINRMKKEGVTIDPKSWILQRFITIGYYALVDFSQVQPKQDVFSENIGWHEIHSLPPLMMDHRHIMDRALRTLQEQINRQPIGYNLLPHKFTMPELQKLYETILDKPLDRRNFQRKITSFGFLKKLKETKKGVAHKAPFLYMFDVKKYNEALQNGLTGGW